MSLHLTEDLKHRVTEAARRHHVSEEEYMRTAIERSLHDDAMRPTERPRPRLPLFRSGDPTLAERVDEILAEGFGQDGLNNATADPGGTPTSAHGTDANPTRQPGRPAAQQLDIMIDKTAEDRLHTNRTRSRLTRD